MTQTPQAVAAWMARDKTPRADEMTVNALVSILTDGVRENLRAEILPQILQAINERLHALQVDIAPTQVSVAAPNVNVTSDPLDVNVEVPGFTETAAALTRLEAAVVEANRIAMLPVTKEITRDPPTGQITRVVERRG